MYNDKTLDWLSKSATQCFLYLLEHGQASSQDLAKQLWPNSKAESMQTATLSRMRHTTSAFADVKTKKGIVTLTMQTRYAWDSQDFEAFANEVLIAGNEDKLETAINSYQKGFLPNYASPWAEEKRDKQNHLMFKLISLAVEKAKDAKNKEVALERLKHFIDTG